MLRMDQVYVVRHKVLVEGFSVRQVARELHLSRNTVRRYVEGAEPGWRKPAARSRPTLEAVRPRLEELLAQAPRGTGGKQRLPASQLHRLLLAEGRRGRLTPGKGVVAGGERQAAKGVGPAAHRPGGLARGG